jgi:chromosome segregation ATPase
MRHRKNQSGSFVLPGAEHRSGNVSYKYDELMPCRMSTQMREQEIESTKLYDKVRRLTEQFTEASAALERIHMQADQKDRLAADVRKDLEMARLEAEQTLADQVQLQQRVQVTSAKVSNILTAIRTIIRFVCVSDWTYGRDG